MTAYLTTEQALADYVDLVIWLKNNIKGARNSRVAAFGGRHAGMLATWFRIKYPHTVRAALASSAPFMLFSPTTRCDTYYKAVTSIYKKTWKNCPSEVKKIWPILEELGSTEEGCRQLGSKFNLCQRLSPNHFRAFRDWIRDSLIGVTLINYPFRSSNVPPHPLKVVCDRLRKSGGKDGLLMDAVIEAVGFSRNGTGSTTCYAVPAAPENPAWLFQQCTEFVQPLCGDGVADMFYPTEWDYAKFCQKCRLQFGVQPQVLRLIRAVGGPNLCGTTKVFFTNGDLDPWSAYGIVAPPSRYSEYRGIRGGAHCVDLRFSNDRWDSHSLRLARRIAKRTFRRWLAL
ncbi:hypothetical protein HPB50_015467 [Hyalomma asiaticum]|uniref:Uncharacterized protein n=1 Tax=Hyalomma asiaticum TaxID=266040 RepID=A0ACB7T2D9_HYAAI|nr:hypothetical protein HPB50_015467 [Hyalomma asiaticum]